MFMFMFMFICKMFGYYYGIFTKPLVLCFQNNH